MAKRYQSSFAGIYQIMSSYRQDSPRAARAVGLLLLLFILCLGACSRQGASNLEGQTSLPASGGLPVLPRPSSLPRLGSAAEAPPGYRLGAEYEQFLPNHNVSIPAGTLEPAPGDGLNFESSFAANGSLGDCAYALFRIADQSGATGPSSLTLDWRGQPAPGTVWVGLANYVTDRWDWHSLPAGDGKISIDDQLPYVASFGQSFVAVVLTGNQTSEFHWLLLGEPLAQAEVSASQVIEEGGLKATVDASASQVFGASEWFVDYDWEDDGTFDVLNDEDGIEEHLYVVSSPGTFEARVRIHDAVGTSAEELVSFVVPDGSVPVAQLSADVQEGNAPLTVNFDASASLPSNGASITSFDWDMDGDGEYERSSGKSPLLTHVFGQVGATIVSVRVTDNSALSDTQGMSISLDHGWRRVQIDANASLETSDPALILIGPVSQRRPAVAYHDALSGELRFSVADNSSATNWGSPIAIASGNTGYGPAMMDVAGFPAVAFNAPSEWTPGAHLYYARAKDALGSEWSEPLELSTVDGGETIMTLANGKPCIYSITNKYSIAAFTYLVGFRAKDNLGLEWNEAEVPDYVEEEAYLYGLSVMQLGGKPALFYGYYADTPAELHKMRFTRADANDASTWLDPVIFGDVTAGYSSLAMVGGNPAAAYSANLQQDGVYFVRASAADGSAWETEPVTVDARSGVGMNCSMGLVNALPLITYFDSNSGDLLAVFAADANGSAWETPMVVDGSGNMGQFSELIVSGTTPVVAYSDATGQRVLGAYYN